MVFTQTLLKHSLSSVISLSHIFFRNVQQFTDLLIRQLVNTALNQNIRINLRHRFHFFLNFFEKYLRNAGTKGESSRGMKSLSRVVPAPVGDELTERIQQLTREIFTLLDCRGTVRIDFILDEHDVLYVNEPNTIPGSLAFYLWKECGVSFPQLVEKMVESALRAHADENKSVYAYDSSILQKVSAGVKGSKA